MNKCIPYKTKKDGYLRRIKKELLRINFWSRKSKCYAINSSVQNRFWLVIIRKVANVSFQFFSLKIMRLLIKILTMRGPRVIQEYWGIPVKISIHSVISDPVFTFCFRFEKLLWNDFKPMLSKAYASKFSIIKSCGRQS